ncbi:hypothetical protein ZWY2020_017288 [Hordeum vulgare]|nr:hypothetical protein ZWY2020_017288 [Hordeum vulgare]
MAVIEDLLGCSCESEKRERKIVREREEGRKRDGGRRHEGTILIACWWSSEEAGRRGEVWGSGQHGGSSYSCLLRGYRQPDTSMGRGAAGWIWLQFGLAEKTRWAAAAAGQDP